MALRLLSTRLIPRAPLAARALTVTRPARDNYNIPEVQKMMQEDTTRDMADNPTYLKRKGSDKGFALFGLIFSCCGGLYALNGHFNMAHGQNKID